MYRFKDERRSHLGAAIGECYDICRAVPRWCDVEVLNEVFHVHDTQRLLKWRDILVNVVVDVTIHGRALCFSLQSGCMVGCGTETVSEREND